MQIGPWFDGGGINVGGVSNLNNKKLTLVAIYTIEAGITLVIPWM